MGIVFWTIGALAVGFWICWELSHCYVPNQKEDNDFEKWDNKPLEERSIQNSTEVPDQLNNTL